MTRLRQGYGGQADVLVVGAGPAGSIAALVLAGAGVKVHLVDRASFPRDKLCGDTLNPGSLAILDQHGLGSTIRARSLSVRGMTDTGPRNAVVTADYPDGLRGASLMRRDLDLLLVEAAVAAGARFTPGVAVRAPVVAQANHVQGVRVATSAGEESWPARIVVAADGRHSTLGFLLGLSRYAAAPRRWAFGAYFTDVDGVGEHGEMHIRPEAYIGVAPLPGGVTNLCVVRDLRHLAEPSHRMNAERSMAAAIGGDPLLRDRFARARRISAITTLGPLAVESTGSGCPGLLLAGDAAGFIDPMTGDGLRFALRGGELAAEAALRELSSGTAAFGALGAARAGEFAGKWRVNRLLRSLVASPHSVAVAASVSARWAAPVRMLIGIAGDVHLARVHPS